MADLRITLFPRRFCLGVCGLVWLALALSSEARAATVREGTGSCSIVIEGPIADGDRDALAAFEGDKDEWNPDMVVCLDSSGGSLVEGARIAQFVHEEGLQTRVGDGSICHSVCAIIFMMGNRHGGPTSVEENRTLHIGGELAFPGLAVIFDDARSHSPDALQKVYARGFESLRRIVDLANAQRPFEADMMMHPGLVQAMLDTPATELFHIDTIEQALSWDIGLEGVPEYLPSERTQRQMVCENGLSRGFRRPSEIYGQSDNNLMTAEVFKLAPLSGSAQYRLLDTYDAEEIAEGIVYSFRYWDLPVQCRVGIERGAVEVCGADAGYRHTIGDCHDDIFRPLPDYARYHPQTEFRALRDSRIRADVLRAARCTRRSTSGAVLRDEDCFQAIDIFRDGDRKYARHSLHWQGGGQTVIEIAARPLYVETDEVDIYRVDGAVAGPHGDTGACLTVSGSGDVICVTPR